MTTAGEQTYQQRGVDRRKGGWRTFVGALRGRRKSARRATDSPVYPDFLSPWLFAAIVLLLMLSLGDAFATLLWVELGWATEANPIMAAILPYGHGVFVFYKFFLTVAGVAFLVYCYPFYRINLILAGLNACYLALGAYHLQIYLLHQV